MRHFSAITLTSLLLAAPALAFSIDINLPNLTFPPTDTTVSTQSCTPTAPLPCP